MNQRALTCRRGFTLVEALSTLVIMAVLGSVTSTIIFSAVRGYRDAATAAQLHGEASGAMDRITRELRAIPLSGTAPDIASVTSTSITWSTNSALSLSGTNLMLSIAGGTSQRLLSDVASFSIQTYDESNTALASSVSGAGCAAIRRVQVQVTLTRFGISETLRTRVFVRSTMEGNQ
jgi:prepilin-type N-terminal cleavage/methylation domain-containing protein